MSNVIPFPVISGVQITTDEQGRFNLNALHKASGGEKKDGPSYWLALDTTKQLVEALEKRAMNASLKSDTGIPVSPVQVIKGNQAGVQQGTFVHELLAVSYASWISPEFHLKVNQTFIDYRTGRLSVGAEKIETDQSAIKPSKEFRALFGIARLVGMDKNAAAISANQAVAKMTGTNVLSLLGHEQLEAENQDSLFFTPTELGAQLSVSGRKLNAYLALAGLQTKKGDHWVPTDAAKGLCRIMDTGKRHGDGTLIQQVKWSDGVLALIKKEVTAS